MKLGENYKMEKKIDFLIQRMTDKQENEAYKYADQLGEIGTDEALEKTLSILKNKDVESAYLAARALGKMKQNNKALATLLEVIHDKNNKQNNGALVEALEAFDLRESFVEILRIYLFGNYKASTLAKEYLDHTEFDITPRVIKKAEKHWNHYQNNAKKDEGFVLKKREVEAIFNDLRSLFEGE
ncbi:MAG: HEAT repeat domain-containing protein [Anditalea sp.]